jgi:glucose-1-phosphate cytidylyltransferase
MQLERREERPLDKIKVGILAGGGGTRLAEETDSRPKPMVEVGGKPILWHIMMHYAHYGFKDFAIALGYKGDMIKRYMLDYCALNTNLSVHFGDGRVERDGNPVDDWNVDLIDTGQDTMTGGRIKRLKDYLGGGTFMLTWGDGVSDVNLHELLKFHRAHGRLATVTAVRPPARFGRLDMQGDQVVDFAEKPQLSEGWINGAFFVLEPAVFDYIEGDPTQWEKEPLEHLARDGELMAYKHGGFWQCMDTLRDKRLLEGLWATGDAPWKIWDRKQKKETAA